MSRILIVVATDTSMSKWLKSLRLPFPLCVKECILEEPVQHHALLQVETYAEECANDGNVVVVVYVIDAWFPFASALETLRRLTERVTIVAREPCEEKGPTDVFYPASLKSEKNVVVLGKETNGIDVVEAALNLFPTQIKSNAASRHLI